MELVLVIATITSFFSHFVIERTLVANTVSVVFASLITWALAGAETGIFVEGRRVGNRRVCGCRLRLCLPQKMFIAGCELPVALHRCCQ